MHPVQVVDEGKGPGGAAVGQHEDGRSVRHQQRVDVVEPRDVLGHPGRGVRGAVARRQWRARTVARQCDRLRDGGLCRRGQRREDGRRERGPRREQLRKSRGPGAGDWIEHKVRGDRHAPARRVDNGRRRVLEVTPVGAVKRHMAAQRIGRGGGVEVQRPEDRVSDGDCANDLPLREERRKRVNAISHVRMQDDPGPGVWQVAEEQAKVLLAPRVREPRLPGLQLRRRQLTPRVRDHAVPAGSGEHDGGQRRRVVADGGAHAVHADDLPARIRRRGEHPHDPPGRAGVIARVVAGPLREFRDHARRCPVPRRCRHDVPAAR